MKKRILSVILILAMLFTGLPIVSVATDGAEQEKEGSDDNQLEKIPQENALNIYFYPLNPIDPNNPEKTLDYAAGDSFIITFGDVEILVDAGATENSGDIIVEKMTQVISADGKWDYIIATHVDSDHISAFKKVFEQFKRSDDGTDDRWTLGTLIDFDVNMDDTVRFYEDEAENQAYKRIIKEAKNYSGYYSSKVAVVAASHAKYYAASECCWKKRGVKQEDLREDARDATDTFEVGDATLTILYNYFYDHVVDVYSPDSDKLSACKNVMSVCFMIEYAGKKLLFTGDLEEYDSQRDYKAIKGETKLLEYNKDELEGGVDVYKAAHHGSKTSSCSELIDAIRPNYVIIPAVAGSIQYRNTHFENRFPSQDVIDNLFKYTDKIYIIEEAVNETDDEGKEYTVSSKPYHGNIRIRIDEETIEVTTDNYQDEPIQETPWFKANRTATLGTYVLTLPDSVRGKSHCTLIKYGSTEILIDCGIRGDEDDRALVDKVRYYCRDGVLEYVIITNSQIECISGMIASYKNNESQKNGIFDYFEIGCLIDFYDNTNNSSPSNGSWLFRYQQMRNEMIENGRIGEYCDAEKQNHFVVSENENFVVDIFNTEKRSWKDENDYSLVVLVTFYGEKMLFTSDLTNVKRAEKLLVDQHGNEINNVDFYLAGLYGSNKANSDVLLETIKPEYIIINARATDESAKTGDANLPSNDAVMRMVSENSKVYLTGYINEKNQVEVICDDLMFYVKVRNDKVIDTNGVGIKLATDVLDSKGDVIPPTSVTETQWYQDAK